MEIPFFSYRFNGLIFKILPDISLPLLAVEIRDLKTKEVSFAVLNYQENSLLFEGLGLEETWWVGLANCSEGKLFFHHFADKEYPEPQALIVADVFEQALLWEKKGMYLEEITTEGVLVSFLDKGQKKYQILGLKDGEKLKEVANKDEIEANSIRQNQAIFPSQYTQDTPHFNTVAQFLKQKLGIEAQQQIDYCEFNEKILLAYTSRKKHNLLIMNNKGEILVQKVILQEAQGMGMESFFIVGNKLVCVAERQNLLIFKL